MHIPTPLDSPIFTLFFLAEQQSYRDQFDRKLGPWEPRTQKNETANRPLRRTNKKKNGPGGAPRPGPGWPGHQWGLIPAAAQVVPRRGTVTGANPFPDWEQVGGGGRGGGEKRKGEPTRARPQHKKEEAEQTARTPALTGRAQGRRTGPRLARHKECEHENINIGA